MTEIYLHLILDCEHDFDGLLNYADVDKDKDVLSHAYFELCMCDPQRYWLFDCLEEKLVKGNQVLELLERLHEMRASNFERLTLLTKS